MEAGWATLGELSTTLSIADVECACDALDALEDARALQAEHQKFLSKG